MTIGAASSGMRPMRANASRMIPDLSEAARARHVRESSLPPQAPVAHRLAAIGRRRERTSTVFSEQDPCLSARRAPALSLAGYRAPDEHDLAVEPREHPAAGCGLLNINRNQRVRHRGHGDEFATKATKNEIFVFRGLPSLLARDRRQPGALAQPIRSTHA